MTGAKEDLPSDPNLNKEYETVGNKKVLVVEDNEINQFVATTIFEKWKMKVDVVDNGQLAVDKIKAKDYDVVLMDLQMPVMGGLEATKIIRKELKSNVPIIALTANAIKVTIKIIDVGMNDYVSKPFDHSILYNKIINLINYG
jgi:CheY-like chemotaxis protein